jgi:hypothetical protein
VRFRASDPHFTGFQGVPSLLFALGVSLPQSLLLAMHAGQRYDVLGLANVTYNWSVFGPS